MKKPYYEDQLKMRFNKLRLQRQALQNIPYEIETIKKQMDALKASNMDKEVVSGGGGNRHEEMMIDNIVKIQVLENSLEFTQREVNLAERLLQVLNKTERTVIENMYIDHCKGQVEHLCQVLGYEKSQVYRIKDEAMFKMAIAWCGKAEM